MDDQIKIDGFRIELAEIENVFITLQEAYTVMFENEEFLEYSYDLFLEDIESFSLNRIGYMSTAEALSFLQTMQ